MAQQLEGKKLVIEIKHPIQELRELSDALGAICQPGASKQLIALARRKIQEARVHSQLIRAYTRYLEFKAGMLEREIAQARRL
jgi:hypothetical protein